MRKKNGCALMMLPTETFKDWILNLYIGSDKKAKEKWTKTASRLSQSELNNLKNNLSDVSLEKFQGDSSLYMLLTHPDPAKIHEILSKNKKNITKIELISRGIDEKYWPNDLDTPFETFFTPVLINHLYIAN